MALENDETTEQQQAPADESTPAPTFTAAEIAHGLLGDPPPTPAAPEATADATADDDGTDDDDAAAAAAAGTEGDAAGTDDATKDGVVENGEAAAAAAEPEAAAAAAAAAEKPKPQAAEVPPSVEEQIEGLQLELDQRYAKWQADKRAHAERTSAEGYERDPWEDGKEEARLAQEGLDILDTRQRIVEVRQQEQLKAQRKDRYWNQTFAKTFETIPPEEGQKLFRDIMAEMTRKYGSTREAHSAATEMFEWRCKTIHGQRKAKAAKDPAGQANRVKVPLPKTPITKGGGRITPGPVAGAITRPPPPVPKTLDERIAAFARKNATVSAADALSR